MHPHQMAACLRDAAILELVEAAQLKLVYLDGDFPEMFTRCRRLARSGEVNSSVSADEEVSRVCATGGNMTQLQVLHDR